MHPSPLCGKEVIRPKVSLFHVNYLSIFMEDKMKKSLLFLIAFVLLISMAMIACGEESIPTTTAPASTTAPAATTKAPLPTTSAPSATTTPAADAAKYGGVLVRAISSDTGRPIGYPAEADNAATSYTRPVLESLLSVTRDGEILPKLAVSWKIAADGKSMIIGLRKGVKFHDGSDFNAAVCKWNLDMIIEAKKTTDWTSIDVVDDYTIRINVKQYKNTMLSNLAIGMTQQISKASFDKNGLEWTRSNPVGTGPFILESHERDAKYVFKKNPDYWETGKPYLDGVEFIVLPDQTVQKLAFQKGDIHRIAVSGTTIQE
jgi:peptide/nickel transport system substrate-binding protein